MQQPYRVTFSNRLERLAEQLKEKLFAHSSPFTKRLLVVPSPLIKSWLQQQIALDPQLGICTGIEVNYVNQALSSLSDLLLPDSSSLFSKIPSLLELSLAIESLLKRKSLDYPQMNAEQQKMWQPVLAYLHKDSSMTPSKKEQKRCAALAEQLAHLFQEYALYAGKMVQLWETQESLGWQQELWKELFSPHNDYSYLAKELAYFNQQAIPPLSRDTQVHLFGFSFLPKQEYDFFAQAAKAVRVHYYILSPCQGFWSDLHSNREKRFLKNRWAKKGFSIEQQEHLEDYFNDHNALLANWGSLGRHMAKQIEESDADILSHYELPKSIAEDPFYSDLMNEDIALQETSTAPTLLQRVQADLLLLRDTEGESRVELAEGDSSIQIHCAPSKMREVEILYDNLLKIIEKHAETEDPISPRDVLVMAPDIVSYEPYIKAVFGHKESVLDFQLFDLKADTQSSLVEGFLSLLEIATSRWDAASLMKLLEHPDVCRKQQLKSEELQQLRRWVHFAGIRWGEDGKHRKQLLQNNYSSSVTAEEHEGSTWNEGISRLLLGLTMQFKEEEWSEAAEDARLELFPAEGIDIAQADLLGKWVTLLRSLRDDLRPLTEGASLTLKEWSTYLSCLLEAYFAPDQEQPSSQADFEALLTHFSSFSHASTKLPEEKFGWTTIERHLKSALSQKTMTFRENHLQVVRFCSLLPMRALPAKVIVLMGMSEGVFPKKNRSHSLNLMRHSSTVDYCPSVTDYDRYLFLEALLSAREYLLISYPDESAASGNSNASQPSLMVTELLSYLDSAYEIGETKISQWCCKKHPFYPFDKQYFTAGTPFFSYSKAHFRAAQAFYEKEKTVAHGFLPEFFSVTTPSLAIPKPCEELIITIQQLIDVAKSPIKTYLQKTMGIYLNQEKERFLPKDEPFTLALLDQFLLKKELFKKPPEAVLQIAEKQGKLPAGVFKELSRQRLLEESLAIQGQLTKWEITPQDLFTVEFDPLCSSSEQVQENYWKVPAVQIEGPQCNVKLIGKMSNVTAKGLLVNSHGTLGDLYKIWPHCLLLDSIASLTSPQLFFAKSGKSKKLAIPDSSLQLKHYLEYYFYSRENLSPLLPEWISDLLQSDLNSFDENVRKDFSQQFFQEYVLWAIPERDSLKTDLHWLESWRDRAQRFFVEGYLNLAESGKNKLPQSSQR